MDYLIDRPLPILQKPPVVNDIPGLPRTGGSCRCACHSEDIQRMIAGALAIFGGFFYLLGIVAGRLNPRNDRQ